MPSTCKLKNNYRIADGIKMNQVKAGLVDWVQSNHELIWNHLNLTITLKAQSE